MALVKCTECGHEVSDKAYACPNCGCPINNDETGQQETIEEESYEEPQKKKWWIWALAAGLLSLVGVGIFFLATSKHRGLENESTTTLNEADGEDVNKGKYKIVLYNDNEGEFYNPDEGRICSFTLADGRSEPMKLRLSQSLNIMGKNSDRLYLTNNRLFADYTDYLDYNSAYKPNKGLGLVVEKKVTDDAVVYYMQFEKGQIEETNRPKHQFNLNNGADFTMVYYNDEHGSMYDGKGKRICAVSKRYSSVADLHVNLTKSVSFFGTTTKEIHIIGDKVYVSAEDLIEDKYRSEGEPSTQKASVSKTEDKDATIYVFSKADVSKIVADYPNSQQNCTHSTQSTNLTKSISKFVGTYYFSPRKDNHASVDMYDGQRWWKERKLVGYIEWIEFLVVMKDGRVSLLEPSRKRFVGEAIALDNDAFVISINSSENASVGKWTPMYKNGRSIGRLGDKGYGYPKKVVIDTKTKRIYNGVDNYKNRDISDVEYIMYDKYVSVVEESNNTDYKRNYLNEKYEREYGRK